MGEIIVRTIWIVTAFTAVVLLLAGCGEPQEYTAKFTRPDGVVHKTITIKSHFPPSIVTHNGSVTLDVMEGRSYLVPDGWMVDVEPVFERVEK